jgi:hypothetical protein
LPSSRINENPETILGKIEDAMKERNYILSLFLEHSTLESYVSELILMANGKQEEIAKTPLDTYKRINFDTLLSLSYILRYLDHNLYSRLKKFSKERNKFVHNLIGYDFKDPKIKNEVKKLATDGLDLCKVISEKYENIIYSKYLDSEDFRGPHGGR